ncbi:MAG: hypothetical protein ACRCU2_24785 [Planktothrix sp.]
MSSSDDQHIDLKIQKGIRKCEDDLVIWIQSALDKKETYGNLEESQFRNVVRVAETTESPEVVKNFLRYQLGRDKKWGSGKNSLAESIINDIDKNIKIIAQKIVDDIHENNRDSSPPITKEIEPEKRKLIYIELVRRYLGYGSRHLKYLNSLKSKK